MFTKYITVTLTVQEAEALLTMAASGDYQDTDQGDPGIKTGSNRAQRKIRRALMEAKGNEVQS